MHLAYALLGQPDPAAEADRTSRGSSALALVPSFVKGQDGCRRLTFLGQLVREFRTHAQFQEIVLGTFQDKRWAGWIADPLPRTSGVNPKTRLQQTIARLNAKQVTPLLRFHGDGSGQGVRWEPQNAL